MKKFLSLLLAAALLLCSGVSALAAELYTYSPEDGEKWQHFTGAWTADENGLSVENDGNDVWYYAYIGVDEGWTDYVVEMDLQYVLAGGILFRVTDPVQGVDSFGGYYAGYDSAWAFFGRDKDDQWMTVTPNGPDAPAAMATPYADEMHWKLVVKGNVFTLYINDMEKPYMQTVDEDNAYPAGGIGVRVSVIAGDESGYFKNIKVYTIDE